MKKILNKDVLFIIFLFIAIFSFVNVKPLDDLDELWNYNFARNILEGLLPYKDFNIIVTPLASMIASLFLWLLGNELIVMRILCSILFTGIFYLTYKIFKKVFYNLFANTKIINTISFFYCLILFYIYIDNFRIDYNFFSIFLILIILNIELKYIKKPQENEPILENILNKKLTNLLIGILLACVLLTKQSIGAIACFVGTFYIILLCRNKKDLKVALKIIAIRILGIMLTSAIFILYLITNNLINDFLNYAVLGITSFKNKIEYNTLLQNENIHIKILSVISPIIIILTAIYILIGLIKKKNEKNYTLQVLFVYSIIPIILMFPISDVVHFICGEYITFILEFYIFTKCLKWIYNKIRLKRKQEIFTFLLIMFQTIFILVTLCYTITNYYIYLKNNNKTHNIKHFSGIIIEEGLKQKIEEVENFIKTNKENGIKVYILDAEACIYNIPLDIYIKDYDMFLIGNLGENGIQEKIEEIKRIEKNENAVFLIKNENYSLNWQTPMQIINYVKENLEKIEEVSIYNVYK